MELYMYAFRELHIFDTHHYILYIGERILIRRAVQYVEAILILIHNERKQLPRFQLALK